jgi:hypothetical protein
MDLQGSRASQQKRIEEESCPSHLMTSGSRKRKREGLREKIYPSKAHPSDPLPPTRLCILTARSVSAHQWIKSINKFDALMILSHLHGVTNWGPSLQPMSLWEGILPLQTMKEVMQLGSLMAEQGFEPRQDLSLYGNVHAVSHSAMLWLAWVAHVNLNHKPTRELTMATNSQERQRKFISCLPPLPIGRFFAFPFH